MKKHFSFFKSATATTCFIAMVFMMSCNSAQTEDTVAENPAPVAVVNAEFAIASPEYSTIAAKALEHLSNFEFDAWGTLLDDNVEYYFPDGDVDTRTKLAGKPAVLAWWKNWHKTSGIQSMTLSLPNHIPVEAIKVPNMTGLPGIYVFSFISNEMVYGSKKASLRMNFSAHFNQDKLIDRYYTYYDRAPIIEAMGTNMLEDPAAKGAASK